MIVTSSFARVTKCRLAILDSAARLISEQGFAHTSVEDVIRAAGSGVQLHPVAGRLRPVSTSSHVAPAASTILCLILKHASAPRVGAAPHAWELAENERVGGALDDRDEETGEGIADGHEGAGEAAVAAQLDAPRAGTASEDPVDLTQGFEPNIPYSVAAFGKTAQHRAHAAGIAQHGQRARRLLHGAPLHGTGALRVEDVRGLEPMHEAPEFVQRIGGARAGVGVHEVEPQPLRDERERVSLAANVMCDGGGELERRGHLTLAYPVVREAATG
jgi:hypothetical protein